MNQPTRKYRRNTILAGLGVTLGAVLMVPQVASAAGSSGESDQSDEKIEVVEVEDTDIFSQDTEGPADSPFAGEQDADDNDQGEAVELEDDIDFGYSTEAEDDLDWDAVDAAIKAGDTDALAKLGLASVEATDETEGDSESSESTELEDDIDFGYATQDDGDIDWDAVDAAIKAGDMDALAKLGLAPAGELAETEAD